MDAPPPISVYPTAPPKVSALRYNAALAVFALGNLLTMVSLVLLQFPSLLIFYAPYPILPFCAPVRQDQLKRWFYARYRAYIRLTEQVWASWVVIITSLMLPRGKIVFYGDYAQMAAVAQSIVIANHQIFPDW